MWETIVIGAGPGGISAAIWCHRLGLKTLLLEASERLGGLLNDLHGTIVDYPGFAPAKGYELAQHFADHVREIDVPVRLNAVVRALQPGSKRLVLEGGERLTAQFIVLATGTRRRRLNIRGESRLWGKGVSDSPNRELERARGATVAIAGGGDGALENALILADICPKVHLIHRRATFRARPMFQREVAQRPNIMTHLETSVQEVLGGDRVHGIRLSSPSGLQDLPVSMLFIKAGVTPPKRASRRGPRERSCRLSGR